MVVVEVIVIRLLVIGGRDSGEWCMLVKAMVVMMTVWGIGDN